MKTTITNEMIDDFLINSEYRQRLTCNINEGFYLIKLKNGLQFRIRFKDANGRKRELSLGEYPKTKLEEAVSIYHAKKEYNNNQILKHARKTINTQSGLDTDELAELISEKLYKKIGARLEALEISLAVVHEDTF